MRRCLVVTLLAGWAGIAVAAPKPCESGPPVGERPGPYSFLLATGEHRGKQHCYICATADKPAVIVFARSTSEPLGRLLLRIDRAAAKHQDLRAWATFLGDDQPALDRTLVKWSRDLGLRSVPLGVFEDAKGPPGYKLCAEADVTVLLAVNQKVVANFAFRADELTDERAKAILDALPKICGE